jgi:CBS domain-containing protein
LNNVKQLLKGKGNQVYTTSKDTSIFEALKTMAEKKVGSLIVLEDGEMIGIFTERDHARKVGLMNCKPEDVLVQDAMTTDLITVKPDLTVRECMALMNDNRIRHLPVVEQGKLIGLISIGDVVKDLIEELQFFVKQMENYITGLR